MITAAVQVNHNTILDMSYMQFHHKSFPSFVLHKVSQTKVLILTIAVLRAVNILFIFPSLHTLLSLIAELIALC